MSATPNGVKQNGKCQIFEDRIESIADLTRAVDVAYDRFKHDDLWYRGQADAKWSLLPSIYRSYGPANETDMLYDFQVAAGVRHSCCPASDDWAGWISLAQHYGLPTRLLDWSRSILVAAYFAVVHEGGEHGSDEGGEHGSDDAAIWALSPGGLNGLRASGREALYRLDDQRATSLLAPAFGGGPAKAKVLATVPCQLDIRMMVQQSVFTLHGPRVALDCLDGCERVLIKFVVPADAKPRIETGLSRLGINRSDLYPDLSNLAQHIAKSRRPERKPARSGVSRPRAIRK
jgi:hypothetical protein